MVTFARRPVSEGRRRFPRVPLGAAVEYSGEADGFLLSVDGWGRDISLGGMFIETNIPAQFQERLVVRVTLPRAVRTMDLAAVVRWTCTDGMGVQFGPLGARDTHDIAGFAGLARAKSLSFPR